MISRGITYYIVLPSALVQGIELRMNLGLSFYICMYVHHTLVCMRISVNVAMSLTTFLARGQDEELVEGRSRAAATQKLKQWDAANENEESERL